MDKETPHSTLKGHILVCINLFIYLITIWVLVWAVVLMCKIISNNTATAYAENISAVQARPSGTLANMVKQEQYVCDICLLWDWLPNLKICWVPTCFSCIKSWIVPCYVKYFCTLCVLSKLPQDNFSLKLIVAKVDHFHLKNCIFMYVTYSLTPNGESSSVILNYLESQVHLLHPRHLNKRIWFNMFARKQGGRWCW